MAAVTAGEIKAGDVVVIRNEGPAGGPGMREMLAVTARARRGGARRRPSRCSPTAASPAPRTASWPATSRPRRSTAARSRAVRDGDTITIDVASRRLDVDLPDDEIAAPRRRLRAAAADHDQRRAGQVRQAGRRAPPRAPSRADAGRRRPRARARRRGTRASSAVEARRALEHRHVAGVARRSRARAFGADQLARSRSASLDRHQHVVAPPHDQHRDLDLAAAGRGTSSSSSASQRGQEARLSAARCDQLVGQRRREPLRVAHDDCSASAPQPRPARDGRSWRAGARGRPRRRQPRDGQQRLARAGTRSRARRRRRARAAAPASGRRAPARRRRSRPSSCRPRPATRSRARRRARRRSARSPGSRSSSRGISESPKPGRSSAMHAVSAHERRDVQQPVLPASAPRPWMNSSGGAVAAGVDAR